MINDYLVMRYIFIFLLLPLTHLLFACGATDVAFKGLNGPVKYREEGSEKFWFDRDGYLVCAFKCNTVGVSSSWYEYYKHFFDKNGKRIETIVYTDSLFTQKRDYLTYKYDEEGRLVDIRSKYFASSYTPKEEPSPIKYYKKYANGKPNSLAVFKKKKKMFYCHYDGDGKLCLVKTAYDGGVSIERTFEEDKLLCFDILRNDSLIYTESWVYAKNGKLLEYNLGCDTCTKDFVRDKWTYNSDGQLIEKQINHKNYFDGISTSSQNCIVTYLYDEWRNLVGEEWRQNLSGHIIQKKYPILYY